MKVTREYLYHEIERISPLLSVAEMHADIIGEDGHCHIELKDLQGAPFGDIETAKFYSAHDIVKRLECVFEGLYLNGEVCCDADHDFKTFSEAENYARDTGYIVEADNIKLLRGVLKEPDRYVFPAQHPFPGCGDFYIMDDEELTAAFYYQQELFYTQDMKRVMETLVYGAPLEEFGFADGDEDQINENKECFMTTYGLTSEDAMDLVDVAVERFTDNYDCNQPFNDQLEYWARETVEQEARMQKI